MDDPQIEKEGKKKNPAKDSRSRNREIWSDAESSRIKKQSEERDRNRDRESLTPTAWGTSTLGSSSTARTPSRLSSPFNLPIAWTVHSSRQMKVQCGNAHALFRCTSLSGPTPTLLPLPIPLTAVVVPPSPRATSSHVLAAPQVQPGRISPNGDFHKLSGCKKKRQNEQTEEKPTGLSCNNGC